MPIVVGLHGIIAVLKETETVKRRATHW